MTCFRRTRKYCTSIFSQMLLADHKLICCKTIIFETVSMGSFVKKLTNILHANDKTCEWDNNIQEWRGNNQNMLVTLKNLNNLNNIASEFNEIALYHEVYGITQDPETTNYMMVLDDVCEKYNWDVDNQNWKRRDQNMVVVLKSLKNLSNITLKINEIARCHEVYGITQDPETEYYMLVWNEICKEYEWDSHNQNWSRIDQNIFVALKSLNNLNNIELEFNEIATHHEVYGITQDPETNDYMLVWNEICKKCKDMCNAMYFLQNFSNWTSGDNDINKLIQDSQLSDHSYTCHALEWIPYDRFCNIKHIAENEFGEVYRANWIDGCIDNWDNYNQNWRRVQNMFVVLKSIDGLKNVILELNKVNEHRKIYVTLEFMNEVASHFKVNLDYAKNGSLRNYLDTNYIKLSWNYKCLDANPSNRPIAKTINEILSQWCYGPSEELQKQIEEAEEINNNLQTSIIPSTSLGISYKTHSEAIYTSRLLNFNDLPEPKNSDDYYKQNDNIISEEFSESLQVDISQLNINEDGKL
ncbi:kinase-like domain-containing protein [Rhizophagus irregularis DAOM 181602=DAOM 197198]|nr:kinase-like domain-containing protein [Rhizophagus irregularis DAOM 181602=DAOM 197198]